MTNAETITAKVAQVRDRLCVEVDQLYRKEKEERRTFDRRYLVGMMGAYTQAIYMLDKLVAELRE